MSVTYRKKQFTSQERTLIKILIKRYNNIIENKNTDVGTSTMKKKAWDRIAYEFNNSAVVVDIASSGQLRRLWQNMKQRHKANLAKERLQRMASGEVGGGACPDLLSESDIVEKTDPLLYDIPDAMDTDVDSKILEESLSLPVPPEKSPQIVVIKKKKVEFPPAQLSPSPPPSPQPPSAVFKKSNIDSKVTLQLLKKEHQARERRANEIHKLELQILREKLRMAKARAELAEKELPEKT